MEDIGQMFRLGTWVVKPDSAREFVDAWQDSSDWLTQRLTGERGIVLLEDPNDPGRYISFAPISDPGKVQQLMEVAEFQELWSKVMELCETATPSTLRVVASSRP